MVGGPPEMYTHDPGVLVFFSEWRNAFLFCVPLSHHHDEVVERVVVPCGDLEPTDHRPLHGLRGDAGDAFGNC